MLRQEQISEIIDSQQETFLQKGDLVTRKALADVPVVDNFATIITGLRRCGKSTLLLQLLRKDFNDALYINFEDIRLTAFETSDFARLQKEIERRELRVIFFDEIQLIDKWEIFVHQLLNSHFQVFITGSNASLLSKEMGTHLTGRHLSMELFPFSFTEFLSFTKTKPNKDSLSLYLQNGGMPEYVKNKEPLILGKLIDDILIRDIAIRYGIRDVETLKKLTIFLISNVGKPVSGNKLAGTFGIKSTTTIVEYFNYLRDSYLIDFLPQFSYSLKAQARNPKKVYAIDTGFIDAVSASFTKDKGRKLENLVYLHLRRQTKNLYSFKDQGECDFVVFDKDKATKAIQVCYKITDENFEREYSGLIETMNFFKLKKGIMVTMDQEDKFDKDGSSVELIPAYKFLTITE
ncbi:ATP-binding protein [Salibacter sp.]|jgi:hypothetical protein|uniref:ATP-binding protein n=1 Tax=Salibacter sp. TaxID=2010995 RepID=UPI0028708074|nr:ATP-binding protein [Salibacter sp.]MDR9487736.1 ATP-binding protein [Salibacter sp.]